MFMKYIFMFRIEICIFLLLFIFILPGAAATVPGTFPEWTTKCLKNLKEYAQPLPFGINGWIVSLSDENKTLLESSFRAIGRPELRPLIDQYNIDHPKKSTPEKPGFVQKLILIRDSELCIIGDIHSSLHSFLRILWRLILTKYLDINLKIIKPDFYMIFMGDYTDRGRWGVEVLITLLMLANQNKDHVFLLRGNHEEKRINEMYGFSVELKAKYGDDPTTGGSAVLDLINEWYSHLPLALFVGRDGTFAQCCHGGIEPTFGTQDFLRSPNTVCDLEADKWQGFSWCDFALIGGKVYSDETRGAIVGRGVTTDVSDFLGKNSLLKCFLRGHQHYNFGLKMLGPTNQAPIHWAEIVAPEIKVIKLADYTDTPVYTFSTGAEGVMVPFDCSGIVKVGATWDDWTLTPYEFSLPDSRDGKFALLKKNTNYPATSSDPLDMGSGGWQDTTPVDPISPEIIATLKLSGLKTSLENLKTKLDTLKMKLTSLKRH